MLDLTENPKLDSTSTNEISAQKISVSDKSDSFVIDLESFPHGGGSNKEIFNQNPRIIKSLSRKGSQRGDMKIISLNDKDSFVSTSPSPRGSSMAEKPMTAAVASADQTNNPQVHHQITITTGNIAAATESRFNLRRNVTRRFSTPWLLDPKRILFLFATLSSMGTILLIYFTLSIGKAGGVENGFD